MDGDGLGEDAMNIVSDQLSFVLSVFDGAVDAVDAVDV